MGVLNALAEMERLNTIGAQRGATQIKNYLQAERDRALGKRFFENYDPSPEGLQRFAADHNLDMPALARFTALVKGFEDFANNRADAQAAYTNALSRLTTALRPQTSNVSPGQRIVDQASGRVIYTAPPAPAQQKVLPPNATVYDPRTQTGVYTAPPAPERKLPLAPSTTVYDPRTNKAIFTAPSAPPKQGSLTAAQKQAAGDLKDLRNRFASYFGRYSAIAAKQNILTSSPKSQAIARQNLTAALALARQYKAGGHSPAELGLSPETIGQLLAAGALTRDEAEQALHDLFPEVR